jgi:glycosyltransferase involved in cell wall biosynthesis
MKWVLRLARLVVDAGLALGWLLRLWMLSCRRRGGSFGAFVSICTVAEARQKWGSDQAMLADDLPGFFDHVLRLHYDAPDDGETVLSDRVTAVELRPPLGRLRLANLVRAATLLVDVHRRFGLKLIHARDFYECGMAAWLASRCTGVPFCLSVEQDYDLSYRSAGRNAVPAYLGVRALSKAQERWLVRRAPMILAIRKHLAEYAQRQGAPPERVFVLHHGIDIGPFDALPDPAGFRRRMGLPPDAKIVNAVGRLSPERYCGDTIEIARLVAAERPEAVFLMAGGGPEQRRLEARIAAERLERHVRLLGFLPHRDVAELFLNSDVSLVTAGGLSLIEACAAGTPVVAYDLEWHGELIRDGETGRLVAARDTAAAARAVLDLFADPDACWRLGQAARRMVMERHTFERHQAARRALYRRLVSARARP